MLVEIFTTLLADTQSEIPELKKTAHYKDEFNNEQWNPVFPCAFFRYDGTKPVENSRASDGSALKSKILISVFVGDKDLETPVTLNTVEKIENLFNDNQLSVGINSVTYSFPVRLTPNGSDFVTYVKGLSVYRVQIEIEVPTGVMPESDIELPGAVNLLLPNNGATDVDAAHANLSYDDLPDVLDYEIMLGDLGFENVFFHVTFYEYLNITLPDGIIEPGNTYYWMIRARNIAGYGEWSTPRSFTTIEATGITPLNPSQITNNTLWCRTDSVITTTGNKVTQFTDLSGNGNHLLQTTDANRPVLTANVINGHSAILHDPTGNVRKCVAYNDTAKKFEILNASGKSFMITAIPDSTYSYDNNPIALLARSNSNFGDNWLLGKYNDNLNNIRGVYQFPKFNTNIVAVAPVVNNLMQIIFVCNAGLVSVYIHGKKISENTVSSLTTNFASEIGTYLTLGAEYYNAGNSIQYKGYSLELAFWNKVLSTDEIAALYEYHKEYYGVQ